MTTFYLGFKEWETREIARDRNSRQVAPVGKREKGQGVGVLVCRVANACIHLRSCPLHALHPGHPHQAGKQTCLNTQLTQSLQSILDNRQARPYRQHQWSGSRRAAERASGNMRRNTAQGSSVAAFDTERAPPRREHDSFGKQKTCFSRRGREESLTATLSPVKLLRRERALAVCGVTARKTNKKACYK